MSKFNPDMVKDFYNSLSCEKKGALILAVTNVVYFALYIFGYNWISFGLTKVLIILTLGIIKVSFLGKEHKR